MKRILTIQDISCFGKCSITIALPVISAMGVETAVLPTAVLSTHTMFTDYRKKDLTDTLLPFAEQWKDNGITFDAIYTGYLGTPDAAEAAVKVVEMLRRDDTLVFVDPVIGDHGKPYAGIGREYTACLDRLASMADHIVPNITEACLMTGSEYRAEYDQEYIDGLAREICRSGARSCVVTGVSFAQNTTGFYGFDKRAGKAFSYQNSKIEASYHGTGDLFASTAVGALVLGMSPDKAFRTAADFTALTIAETMRRSEDRRFGICFETVLPALLGMLEENLKK